MGSEKAETLLDWTALYIWLNRGGDFSYPDDIQKIFAAGSDYDSA